MEGCGPENVDPEAIVNGPGELLEFPTLRFGRVGCLASNLDRQGEQRQPGRLALPDLAVDLPADLSVQVPLCPPALLVHLSGPMRDLVEDLDEHVELGPASVLNHDGRRDYGL